MNITTYSTHRKAHHKLDAFYFKNTLVVYDLLNQFAGIAKNFQRSIVRAAAEDRDPLAQEFKEACSQLGKGDRLTAPLKLYNCNRGYGFEISYLGDGADIMKGFFSSAEDLAAAVQDHRHRSSFSAFGLKETPFLYTVTEPYHFSEEEKKKARAIKGYEKMDPRQQSDADALLEAYVEYGLGPEERQEFEKAYLKFFN
ncbi:MAG: hypothetical protein AABX31_05135 [Nanoarchaeota archaeon]|mgnify:CR=1 FL=1